MGMLVNPYVFGAGGGPPPGGDYDWSVIAALTAPTAGAFTFSGLDLTAYDRVEIWLCGLQTGTDSTTVRLVVKTGPTPTVESHDWGIISDSSGGSSDDNSGAAAAVVHLVSDGSAFPLGNVNDQLGGLVVIDAPNNAAKRAIVYRGVHGFAGGSENVGGEAVAAKINGSAAIKEIVIEGSSSLTAGVVLLVGFGVVP